MGSIFQGTLNSRMLIGGNIQGPRYIRSDFINALTDNDINWLRKHNFMTIIDLRSDNEVFKMPCFLANIDGFHYYNMPVNGGNTVPSDENMVIVSYLAMADEYMFKIIEKIENSPENVVYFCTAGKDRTGVVSALLLKRAGADDEIIVSDYMQSYDNLNIMIKEYAKNGADIDVITPKEKYIRGFLNVIG